MAIHHGIWECVDEDASEYPVHVHSDLTYDHPPCRPLDFPSPSVYRCKNTSIQARDHRSGTVHRLRNVIIRSEPDSLGNKPKTAYLVKKKLSKSTYGSLHLCIVLKRISRSPVNIEEQRQDAFDPEFVEWESIDSLAVIKVSAWSKIHAMRGRHLEDPIKEISAMQLLGNYHPHIQGTTEVLQDDNYLYTVMPYLSGGDLYGRLTDCKPEQALTSEDKDSEFFGFQETRARGWFRQLIKAIFHLQKKGVCHRDICLENLLFDKNDNLVLIDPGMSLRVPYSDPCNYGCVADASAGTSRILMISQGQGGKHMYAAPEVLSEQEAVDAFAIDLWSVGVILFVMLVGLAPFKWAHPTDQRYSKISKGGLKELMKMLDIPLSPEACDLLQGLFYSDPCKRFTLADIMNHPWFQGKRFANTPVSTSKQPKIFTFSLETRKHNSPPRKNKRHEKRKKTKHNQQQLPSRKSLLDLPF